MKKLIIKLSAILALGISALGISGCCAEEIFDMSVTATQLTGITETEKPVPFEVFIQNLTALSDCLKENERNTSGGSVQISVKKTDGGSTSLIGTESFSFKVLEPGEQELQEYSIIFSDPGSYLVEMEISSSSSSNKKEVKSDPFFINIDGNLSGGPTNVAIFQR